VHVAILQTQAQGKWTVRARERIQGTFHLSMVGRYIRARGRRIRVEVEGWGRVLHVIVGPWRWKVEAGLLSES
jgi:hypothetical protein